MKCSIVCDVTPYSLLTMFVSKFEYKGSVKQVGSGGDHCRNRVFSIKYIWYFII
jgi:hypothetical protein